jgi:hypothetical protein
MRSFATVLVSRYCSDHLWCEQRAQLMGARRLLQAKFGVAAAATTFYQKTEANVRSVGFSMRGPGTIGRDLP